MTVNDFMTRAVVTLSGAGIVSLFFYLLLTSFGITWLIVLLACIFFLVVVWVKIIIDYFKTITNPY